MKTQIKGSSYFLIVFMIFMLVVIGFSTTLPYFESKLLPILLSSFGFILAAIGLRRDISSSKKLAVEKSAEAKTEEREMGWRNYWIPLAWVFGFILSIYLLGFLITLPLYILAYMKMHGTKWHIAIICAIVSTAVIYGVFEIALRIPLYRGLLLTLFGY